MAISLGILFGIIALISWGSADAFTKKLTNKVGAYHSVLYRSLFSALILLFASLYFTGTIFPSLNVFFLLLGISFIGYLAYVFYVKGIEAGNVSVISPIAHSSVIVTVLLSLFFFRESITLLQAIAMAVIITGVILISFKYSELKKSRKRIKGLGFALATLVGWGLLFFLWKLPLSYTSPFIAAFYIEALIFIFALISAIPLKKKLLAPKTDKITGILALFVGTVLAIGSLFYTLGINLEFVSLVAPIAAASPFIAVIFSRIFLKEMLELNQKIAVAMIIIGLIVIAL